MTADVPAFGHLRCQEGVLPLRSMEVRAKVSGLVAHTVVKQTFRNAFGVPTEATYIFPLPDQAAVTGFRMEVAGRAVEGRIRERAAARQEYQAAVDSGRRAALAEEDRPGVFTIQVGNIMPGEEATVRLTLSGPLSLGAHGEATYRFPLVVAPRFTPGAPLDGGSVGDGIQPDTHVVPDASRVTPPTLLPGFPAPVQLTLELDVESRGLQQGGIRTSLHSTIHDEENGGAWRLRLQPGERLDRDFIARFQLAASQVTQSLRVFPDADGSKATFLLTVLPPVEAPRQTLPRDVIFLLDRSTSMEGWKMDCARSSVLRMVESLSGLDRFDVWTFDDVVEQAHGGRGLQPANRENQSAARAFLETAHPRANTILEGALRDALMALREGPKRRDPILVLITDGQVTNEAHVMRTLGAQLHGTRILALGIDQAVNGSFLTRIATFSGGHCELVESQDRLNDAFETILRKLETPVLRDVRLTFQGLDVEDGSVVPSRLPALSPGIPITVSGRCAARSGGSITLVGTRGDGVAVEETVHSQDAWNDAARPMWARGMLRDLDDRFDAASGDGDALRRKMVDVSLENRVLSRFTAWIAVDDVVVNAGGRSHPVVQPVEAPRGWGSAPGRPARLGELLHRDNLISLAQLQAAQNDQRRTGGRLGYSLAKLGSVSSTDVTQFLSRQYGVPAINLEEFEVPPNIIQLLSEEVARKHCVLPVNRAGGSLILAMADPSNIFAIDDVKFLTGLNVEVVVSSEKAILEAIAKYHLAAAKRDEAISQIPEESGDDAQLVGLVNFILLEALKKGASDFLVEPDGTGVWFNTTGGLQEAMRPSAAQWRGAVKLLKKLAGITGKTSLTPLLGRLHVKVGERAAHARMSFVVTSAGDKCIAALSDGRDSPLLVDGELGRRLETILGALEVDAQLGPIEKLLRLRRHLDMLINRAVNAEVEALLVAELLPIQFRLQNVSPRADQEDAGQWWEETVAALRAMFAMWNA